MSDESDDPRDWEADKRDFVADTRDAIADERDVAADVRDVVAGARDAAADAREARLQAWEQQLEARARRLGLVSEASSADAEAAEAAGARAGAEDARAARRSERQEAAYRREEATQQREARRRDTLLAAAFAGIAEHLYEAESAEDLLTRIAEAAVTTIAGAERATVTLDEQGSTGVTADPASPESERGADEVSALSFPFDAPAIDDVESRTASLNIYADEPDALDQAARDIGFILAAHASLAARAVGERVRLERLGHQLERALLSRDVIGQAKGILMERLKTTPDEAFEILRLSSQHLNIKLREVARTLTETGTIEPDGL